MVASLASRKEVGVDIREVGKEGQRSVVCVVWCGVVGHVRRSICEVR